jgi:anti-sigma regulatory factor (Ser/Thr protein kinase)
MTILGTLTIPGSERSVAYARRFVRDMIGAGHPALDDAELCTSELVTNAVVHTSSGHGGRVTITVATGPAGGLRIGVADEGAGGRVPYVREDPLAEDGRGILIVTTLAAEWGVETGQGGTTTWFRLPAVPDCGTWEPR